MKLSEIDLGREYSVMIPEHVDVVAWHRRYYDRIPTWGRVIEVGVHYDVPEYMTYGGIQGTPRVYQRSHKSRRADGVTVEYVSFGETRQATIPCRNVVAPRDV